MKKWKQYTIFVMEIVVGCALFALGFDLFLAPHNINAGGLSGLAMIFVHLTGKSSVGTVTFIANIPLFIIAGKKIGKRFFIGSLIGSVALSFWMEVFEYLPAVQTEALLGALYGGVLSGVGCGLVFLAGASTGGADIVIRLLKLRWRNVPIGKIVLAFDGTVVVLTGIAFQEMANMLYCGITIYVCTQVLDAVVYSFDYSKVALIISPKYDEIAEAIGTKLDRGATFLYGQGTHSGQNTKVVLTAVKRQQLADLKELVVSIDPDAFIILQESHQVLGDGFIRYSKDQL